MSKVLCIDQATKITGYSVWIDKEFDEKGYIEVDAKKHIYDRMKEMGMQIGELLDEIKPDFAVIEDTQLQGGINTFQQLCVFQGVVIGLLDNRNIPYTIVRPCEWRKTCGIKGKKREEQKANTQKFVLDKYGIEATEDEADAIGIGEWAMANLKGV